MPAEASPSPLLCHLSVLPRRYRVRFTCPNQEAFTSMVVEFKAAFAGAGLAWHEHPRSWTVPEQAAPELLDWLRANFPGAALRTHKSDLASLLENSAAYTAHAQQGTAELAACYAALHLRPSAPP